MPIPLDAPFKIRMKSLNRNENQQLQLKLATIYGRSPLFGSPMSTYAVCTPHSWCFSSGNFPQYPTIHINHIKRIFNLGGQ